MIEAHNLIRNPDIRHGFFTREGGYSDGDYEGLNCIYGTGDDPELVRRNRAHVATALGLQVDRLVTPYQHHSADVVIVGTPWKRQDAPKADGLVSARPGIAIGITTADCAPVLFADEKAQVIGAAHAGWRGALAGVTDRVIEEMERLGAARQSIAVAVGPTISGENYEVGPEFHEQFMAADRENARFFRPSGREGHFMFDLPAYLLHRLQVAEVGSLEHTGQCTYADEERFYSYRRVTHRGGRTYGGQISAITLGPDAFMKDEI